jgi:hypothetical protein
MVSHCTDAIFANRNYNAPMPSGKIKAKDLEKLRQPPPVERPKKAVGHTVTRAARVIKNEREYDRKRDKRVKKEDLE